MKVLDAAERFVFQSPRGRLLAVLAALMVVKTGAWAVPNIHVLERLAQDPFRNPFPAPWDHYMLWNWLAPFLAWCVGALGKWPFFLFNLALALGFTAAVFWLLHRALPDRAARAAWVLFAALPVSTTAWFWVGSDGLTLLLMAVALAAPRAWPVAALAGVGLGMQHFEQAAVASAAALGALLLSRWSGDAQRRHGPAWAAAVLAGVLAGRAGLAWLFARHGMTPQEGRADWMAHHLDILWTTFFLHPHTILFGTLGAGWAVALKALDRGRRAWPFWLALAGVLALMPITADHTRVAAVSSFLLLGAFWLWDEAFLAALPDRFVGGLLLLWAVLPLTWVNMGVPRWSAFPYDVARALNEVRPTFRVCPDDYLFQVHPDSCEREKPRRR
jgi:hypothetical protein